MTFTDDNLSKLEETVELASGMDEDYRFLNLNMHNIQAFIARLKAAEKVCNCLAETGFPKSLRHEAYDHMNEWRKAAGK